MAQHIDKLPKGPCARSALLTALSEFMGRSGALMERSGALMEEVPAPLGRSTSRDKRLHALLAFYISESLKDPTELINVDEERSAANALVGDIASLPVTWGNVVNDIAFADLCAMILDNKVVWDWTPLCVEDPLNAFRDPPSEDPDIQELRIELVESKKIMRRIETQVAPLIKLDLHGDKSHERDILFDRLHALTRQLDAIESRLYAYDAAVRVASI